MTTPVAWLASMDSSPISTVGILFMIDDRNAVNTPVPSAAPHIPYSAKPLSQLAR
ncbi:hypothetical protein D3C86_1976140 [compost metagenome]